MTGVELTVYGLVQGVGFRPFVSREAESLGITGNVRNSGGIVKIKAYGNEEAVEEFVHRLYSCNLPGSRVERIEKKSTDLPGSDDKRAEIFEIVKSTEERDRIRLLPPDISTCADCTRELLDPHNRRFRYPFISCTSCGPRYTIMEKVPYDRENTTMDDFALCPDCAFEYGRSGNIRQYAQTIACDTCGPRLIAFMYKDGKVMLPCEKETAITKAVKCLKTQKIIAIKDVGGYHFAFDANSHNACKRLRNFKNRERKPFAVMFRDMDEIKRYCLVSDKEEEILKSPAKPIVLLHRRKDEKALHIADSVCMGEERIGAMLPSDPVQILLLNEVSPLVMTSGNRGGEPIITEDKDMLFLAKNGACDLVLVNDRRIVSGLDDSVIKTVKIEMGNSCKEIVQFIRRARGYVPEPVFIDTAFNKDIFAAGSDLKNCAALARNNAVFLTGHFGDLADTRALERRRKDSEHMAELLGISPETFIADKHPEYFSLRELSDRKPVKVQHHYAHIASVMAEHGLRSCIGLAYDGTGYGDDESIWGGECLVCDEGDYMRAGHISSVKIIGGDSSSKDAVRTAFCYAVAAEERNLLTASVTEKFFSHFLDVNSQKIIRAALKNDVNTVYCSSMGRLFDAVSAVTGACTYNSYEGECAAALERAAEKADKIQSCFLSEPHITTEGSGCLVIDTVSLFANLLKEVIAGADASAVSLSFHTILADASFKLLLAAQKKMSEQGKNLNDIALAGGTFYNDIILKRLVLKLLEEGFNVYLNEKVPCGDGGLALGQVMAYSLICGTQ